MPAPVAAAAAVTATATASAPAAAVAWKLSPQLRWLVKKLVLPLMVFMSLAPVIAVPFVAVAMQAFVVSLVRPVVASCAQAAGNSQVSEGQVVFPLAAGTWQLTSPYGERVHPVSQVRKMHWGVDFGAADGTPILSVMDGVVTDVVYPISGNNFVTVDSRDPDGVSVRVVYMHMWRSGIFVKPGMQVRAGDVIATVGNSGTSTGAHLHLETWVQGSRVDPVPLLAAYGAIEAADCGLFAQ